MAKKKLTQKGTAIEDPVQDGSSRVFSLASFTAEAGKTYQFLASIWSDSAYL
jgi:hypothetical protein